MLSTYVQVSSDINTILHILYINTFRSVWKLEMINVTYLCMCIITYIIQYRWMFSYSCTYIVPWNSTYQYIAMNMSIILRMNKCKTFECSKFRVEGQPTATQEVL